MISDAHSYLEHNIWEADAKHPLSTLFSHKKIAKITTTGNPTGYRAGQPHVLVISERASGSLLFLKPIWKHVSIIRGLLCQHPTDMFIYPLVLHIKPVTSQVCVFFFLQNKTKMFAFFKFTHICCSMHCCDRTTVNSSQYSGWVSCVREAVFEWWSLRKNLLKTVHPHLNNTASMSLTICSFQCLLADQKPCVK